MSAPASLLAQKSQQASLSAGSERTAIDRERIRHAEVRGVGGSTEVGREIRWVLLNWLLNVSLRLRHTKGPLVSIKNLGTYYIFVNSYQSAVDLFEKRGSIYSSRPKNIMTDLEGWGWTIPIMPYGDELRRSRQLLHRSFQSAVVDDYTELQTASMCGLLERLLKTPDRYPELIRHSIGESILKVAYGYQVLERDDPYISLAEKAIEAANEAEGFFLVNDLPWLQCLPSWFPGTGFKGIAKEGYKLSMSMYHEPYKMAKANYLDGTAMASMTSNLIEAKCAGDSVVDNECLIVKVTGTAYGTGVDTIVSALHSFFLARLLYPEVQGQAQDELDRIVGKDALPTFDDRPNLPYIGAIVKETLRWQVVSPFAAAHTVDMDDEYNGHFIPAGATAFPNLWAMLRDPKEYPEPDKFIPERWLPMEGKELPLDVYKVVFGMGRRICPGRHFADNFVFIGAASILSAFSVTKALGENGLPITPKAEYTPNFIRHPKPFKYVLTPRSDKIKIVIRQAIEATKCARS